MHQFEVRSVVRAHGRVGQRVVLLFFVFMCWSAVPGVTQQREYVQWPMGQAWRGAVVPGHNIESFLTFGTRVEYKDKEGKTVRKVHGGIDFIWSMKPGADPNPEGTATIEAPVYAIADGRLICENRGLSAYTDWPGRVIVIEHTLNGKKHYALYGHLRYPTGRDPYRKNAQEDLWALPPFATIDHGFRHSEDPFIYVRRGQQIGTVMKWRNDDGTLDPSNSHLHFEIRTRETGAWLGNCQGEGYADSWGPDDRAEREQWLKNDYYWLNPVNFIYEHMRPTPLPLVTDGHTNLNVHTERNEETGIILGNLPTARSVRALKREKDDGGNWWYRMLGVVQTPTGRPFPSLIGWIKAYKSKADGTERKSEILAAEIPPRPRRRSTVISYSYSFNDISGLASVPRGENFTIWKAYGGCGLDAVDYATCQVGPNGSVRAYNHDCLSGEGSGTFGQPVLQGCSRAEDFGYVVECCALPGPPPDPI